MVTVPERFPWPAGVKTTQMSQAEFFAMTPVVQFAGTEPAMGNCANSPLLKVIEEMVMEDWLFVLEYWIHSPDCRHGRTTGGAPTVGGTLGVLTSCAGKLRVPGVTVEMARLEPATMATKASPLPFVAVRPVLRLWRRIGADGRRRRGKFHKVGRVGIAGHVHIAQVLSVHGDGIGLVEARASKVG